MQEIRGGSYEQHGGAYEHRGGAVVDHLEISQNSYSTQPNLPQSKSKPRFHK